MQSVWLHWTAIGTLALLTGCASSSGTLSWQGRPWQHGTPQASSPLALRSPGLGKVSQPTASSKSHKQYEADFKLARLLERRGQHDKAQRAYQALLRQNPNDARVHHRLGVLAARKGHLEQAERYLQRALQLGPTSADLLADLGYLHYLQHRLEEAQQDLQRALQVDPGHKRAAINLGLVLGSQGKYEQALAAFRRAGDEAQAYANLAYVCTQRGDVPKAIEYYDHALTLNRNLRPAAEALAQLGQRQLLARRKLAQAKAKPSSAKPVSQAAQAPFFAKSKDSRRDQAKPSAMLVGYKRSSTGAKSSTAPVRQRVSQTQVTKAVHPRASQGSPTPSPVPRSERKAVGKSAPTASATNLTQELWGTSATASDEPALDPFGLEP